jgi:hypothetical protein
MVRIDYDPDRDLDWDRFFIEQIGRGPYFEGFDYQRGGSFQHGGGIGSIFRGLMNFLLPIGKTMGRQLGREAVATGARVLGDYANGENIRSAVRKESRKGLSNFLKGSSIALDSQGGGGRWKRNPKTGQVVKIKRKPRKRPVVSSSRLKRGRVVIKSKKVRDPFDF